MTGKIPAEVLSLFSHIPELDQELFSTPAEWADRIMLEFGRGESATLKALLELMSTSTGFHGEFNPASRMLVLMVSNLCASGKQHPAGYRYFAPRIRILTSAAKTDNFGLSAAAKLALNRLTSCWPEANLLISCATASRFYIPYETSTRFE